MNVVMSASLPVHLPVGSVINAFAHVSDTSVEDLMSERKTQPVTRRRHELMYVLRQLTSAPYSLIGRHLGARNMATVHAGVATIEAAMAADQMYGQHMAYLTRQVGHFAQATLPVEAPPTAWQLPAALSVLRDGALTDAEARKAALAFLQQLEATDGN